MDNPAKLPFEKPRTAPVDDTPESPVPSWVAGICAVAAFASLAFCVLLYLNR